MATDPNRLIPSNLGGTENFFDDVPFVGTVEFKDGLVVSAIIMFFLFLGDLIVPPEYGIIRIVLLAISAIISLVLLIAKPNYLTLYESLQQQWSFFRREKSYNKDISKSFKSVTTSEDNDTRELIGVDRVYPEYNVIEKHNGTMISMIELSGVDLNVTATRSDWRTYQQRFVNKLEGNIDDRIQIYMPMRQYDPSHQISAHETRLEDDKISEDNLLRNYVQDRIAFHKYYAEDGYYRKYYLIVKTDRDEVVMSKDFEKSGIEKVASRFGGGIQKIFAGKKTKDIGLSEREIEHKQLTEASEKAQKYAQLFDEGGGGSDGGQNAGVLSGERAAIILKEFWEGDRITEDKQDGLIREKPFVMAPDHLQNTTNGDNL